MLRCADLTLYTGVTTNLAQRIAKHTNGTGAKYTRGRGPFNVLFTEEHATKSAALQRELRIKKMTRAQKLALAGEG